MDKKAEASKRGRSSRSKGKRVEYAVRDILRGLGYTADRVPSSGASQGFKGDVKATKGGKTLLFEVKARKASFKSIYQFYRAKLASRTSISYYFNSMYVDISNSFDHMPSGDEKLVEGLFFPDLLGPSKDTRTLKKIGNLQKLVKECDYLVIKDNNEEFLFLRFKAI